MFNHVCSAGGWMLSITASNIRLHIPFFSKNSILVCLFDDDPHVHIWDDVQKPQNWL